MSLEGRTRASKPAKQSKTASKGVSAMFDRAEKKKNERIKQSEVRCCMHKVLAILICNRM